MTSLRPGALLVALLAACASPGAPPGGPPDRLPPKLLQVVPESGKVNIAPRAVVFRFDEVVNERPSGASKLEDMFIVSPRPRSLDVDWNREEIWIRPQGGWRKGLTYSVTMLPGMADLRGNVLKQGTTLVFATGDVIPDTQLRGILFDWVRGTPAPLTLVEALDRRDTTLQYVALTDSSGRFTLRFLPPGAYLVRAAVATSSTIGSSGGGLRPFDRRRAWDSTGVTLADSARIELLAFQHDTLGPRIGQLVVRDSVTIKVTLDQPVSAATVLGRDNFVLLTRDSTPLLVDSVFTAEAFAAWEKAG
ncbi:MAG: Ig-like domain-containing protein, partial [Gemmatimonadetes bacterium]|nr:Ig-like domain-containing protein [Gemmatimonadota bacterium]